MYDKCKVCGGPFPDEYDKYSPKAPVFTDGYAYHLDCEGGVLEEVYAEVE